MKDTHCGNVSPLLFGDKRLRKQASLNFTRNTINSSNGRFVAMGCSATTLSIPWTISVHCKTPDNWCRRVTTGKAGDEAKRGDLCSDYMHTPNLQRFGPYDGGMVFCLSHVPLALVLLWVYKKATSGQMFSTSIHTHDDPIEQGDPPVVKGGEKNIWTKIKAYLFISTTYR